MWTILFLRHDKWPTAIFYEIRYMLYIGFLLSYIRESLYCKTTQKVGKSQVRFLVEIIFFATSSLQEFKCASSIKSTIKN